MVLKKLRGMFSKSKKSALAAMMLSLSVGCQNIDHSMHAAIDSVAQSYELSKSEKDKFRTVIHIYDQGFYHEELAIKHWKAGRNRQAIQEFKTAKDYMYEFYTRSKDIEHIGLMLNGKWSNVAVLRTETKKSLDAMDEIIMELNEKIIQEGR